MEVWSAHNMGYPVDRKKIDDILHNVHVFAFTAHHEGLCGDETSSFLGEICCSCRRGLNKYVRMEIVGACGQFDR